MLVSIFDDLLQELLVCCEGGDSYNQSLAKVVSWVRYIKSLNIQSHL